MFSPLFKVQKLIDYMISIILLGLAFASSFLGIVTVKIPLSYFAITFSPSAILGNVNERLKD